MTTVSVLFEKRKQKLIRFYRTYHRLPSYDELARLFALKSKGSLHAYLKKFFAEGILAKSPTGKLLPTTKLFGLKILGSVQAGFPSPAEEELVDTMSLDEWLIDRPDASFLLTVSGDSMIEAGIMKGDVVIVDRSRTAKNGDIVIAEIDHGWTMKYLMKRGGRIWLQAANKYYKNIYPEEELKIGGVVTSVIRKYTS